MKKQETAMQKAIAHYEKLSKEGSNQDYVVANFLKENFLSLEKEQIINTFKNAHIMKELGDETRTEQWYNEKADEWYNKNFNK